MERINPYAVMRNTATYEAYRAYMRKAEKAGQPFFILAFFLPIFSTPLVLAFEKRFAHLQPADGKLLLACLFAPMILVGALAVLGFLRMQRFRRDNPIPDGWRQIPRSSWPPIPGRRRLLP